jgi:hypothetical protein
MLIEYLLLHSHRSSVYQLEAVMHKRLGLPSLASALSDMPWHVRVVSKNPILPIEQEYALCH